MSTTRDVLQGLYDTHGELTPALVVDVAQDPAHPLHDRFVWDDTEAARRYRLDQASGLIRSVQVTVTREDRPPVTVRAWVAERELEGGGEDQPPGHYLPVQDVVASDVTRSAWFRALARDWKTLKRRAGDSAEFAQLVLGDLADTG